jgi:negative regulator of sigma E activity
MSDSVNKQLSSCLDGELPLEEAAMLMKRLGRDSRSRAALTRYILMGEVMRDGLVPGLLNGNFAQRVSEEISSEEFPPSGRSSWRGKVQKLVAGAGVAAAVAAVALVSLQTAIVDPDQTGLSGQGNVETISYTVPEPPDRLNSYLVRHGTQAAMARNSSWTRVVTDEASDAAERSQGVPEIDDVAPEPEAVNAKKVTP